ncbi:DUF5666 domain-containing protein [Acidicapsa dinghuensis]|uniref:DUF5666 domain-containing protein n=1 Tax=Acidicapsa dinghuensis TaxID=2218256 RepID=A0ABW1EDQ9_9BACT|nr:DUF5666 domain-containing protein [Acidicapsa dinghuensis]
MGDNTVITSTRDHATMLRIRRTVPPRTRPHLLLAALMAITASLAAQTSSPTLTTIDGYVTSVQSPTQLDVDTTHVVTSPTTIFGRTSKQDIATAADNVQIQLGDYVQISGILDKQTHLLHATSIYLRDLRAHDRDAISSTAVIDQVFESGSTPLIGADGYRIRISSSTQAVFSKEIQNLQRLHPGQWIRYEGHLDPQRIVQASKISFPVYKSGGWATNPSVVADPKLIVRARIPAAYQPAIAPGPMSQSDVEECLKDSLEVGPPRSKQKTRYSQIDTFFRASSDAALQARVCRIGLSLIPGYQRNLPDGDPNKIHFHFVALENEHVYNGVVPVDGLVFLTSRVTERLKSDDLLAAVIADGIAFQSERQLARIRELYKIELAPIIAGDVAGAFVPGLLLVPPIADALPEHKLSVALEEQRSRVALALLRDAGYNIDAAPEAWRLLAPTHLPIGTAQLKYPNRSNYQLDLIHKFYTGSDSNSPSSSR